MDGGAWQAIVRGVAELDMMEQLSTAQHSVILAQTLTVPQTACNTFLFQCPPVSFYLSCKAK